MNIHTDPFECAFCDFTTTSSILFYKHRQSPAGTTMPCKTADCIFTCIPCNFLTTSAHEFAHHNSTQRCKIIHQIGDLLPNCSEMDLMYKIQGLQLANIRLLDTIEATATKQHNRLTEMTKDEQIAVLIGLLGRDADELTMLMAKEL